MDRTTTKIYEASATAWIRSRQPTAIGDGRFEAFIAGLKSGAMVADLGCGPGWYAAALAARGFRIAALDASSAMLAQVGERAPTAMRVTADLAALPLTRLSLDAAWALNCYSHLPAAELPLALAQLQQSLIVGAPLALTLADLSQRDALQNAEEDLEQARRYNGDQFAGRLFTAVTVQRARHLLEGAGFEEIRVEPIKFWLWITARRARTLPDLVRPGLRLLICGLNPSLYSADHGIPFARPGNRFWSAAKAAGVAERERAPWSALQQGIGFTDVVKRATAGADELSAAEYKNGLRRLEALVRRCEPAATCFVGLDAWRRAVDRGATPGWIANGFAGRPAYLMPSTSGRNARVPLDQLAQHLKIAHRK